MSFLAAKRIDDREMFVYTMYKHFEGGKGYDRYHTEMGKQPGHQDP